MMPIPYAAEELVVRAIRNARPRKPGPSPRWVAVQDAFALGSTYSVALCRGFGLDPDEELDGPACEICADIEAVMLR